MDWAVVVFGMGIVIVIGIPLVGASFMEVVDIAILISVAV